MRGARGVAPASARAAATRPPRAACHKASPDTQQLITTRRSVWGRAGRANAHAARCCTHTRARPSHDAVVRCWRRVPALAPPVVPRHAPVGAPPHRLYFPFTWAPPTPRVVRRPPVHVARTLPRGLALPPHLPLRAGLLGSYERGIVLRSPAQVAVLADVFSGPADLRLPVYGVADGETNVARRGCADARKRASDRELWPHRRCVQLRRPRDPRLLDALTPVPAGGEYRANDRGGGRRGHDAMTRGPPAPLAARGDPPTRFAGTERPSRAAPRRAPRGACRVAPRRARAQFAPRGGGRSRRRSPPPLPCSVAPTRCSSSAARALRRRLGRSPGGGGGGRGGRQGHDVLHAAVQARRGGGGAAAAPARWRVRARRANIPVYCPRSWESPWHRMCPTHTQYRQSMPSEAAAWGFARSHTSAHVLRGHVSARWAFQWRERDARRHAVHVGPCQASGPQRAPESLHGERASLRCPPAGASSL